MRVLFLLSAMVLAGFGFLHQGTQPAATHSPQAEQAEHKVLIALNREIFERVIVGRDRQFLEQITHPEFLVVPPGGIVEDKAEALAGIEAFRAVTGVRVSNERAAFHGNTGVVVGRVQIEGPVPPAGQLGPLRFMTVFVQVEGEWKMLARSLTPCMPAVIKAGRC